MALWMYARLSPDVCHWSRRSNFSTTARPRALKQIHHNCLSLFCLNFRTSPLPWSTCEAVLSEAYHLVGERGASSLEALLRRHALAVAFEFARHLEPVTKLIEKYSNVPMSLADACLVRMTETVADPIILTTDEDFRIYRRHSRQVFPCVTPKRYSSHSTARGSPQLE